MKVLLVDDSPATLEIVKRALDGFKYRRLFIKKSHSVKEALAVINEWQPNFVLTDWHMPGQDGLELIKTVRLKQLNLKIGMVTTADDKTQIEEAIHLGAEFVVSKPFEDKVLHEALLPYVKHFEESELTREIPIINQDLPLPRLQPFTDLIHKHVDNSLVLNQLVPQSFGEDKLPCAMVLFEDRDSQKVKAAGILDIYAVCVLASSAREITSKEVENAVHSGLVSPDIMSACQEVLMSASYAFLDKRTQKSLRVKTFKIVLEPFKKLEHLYNTDIKNRMDLSCHLGEMAQGNMLFVGFMN